MKALRHQQSPEFSQVVYPTDSLQELDGLDFVGNATIVMNGATLLEIVQILAGELVIHIAVFVVTVTLATTTEIVL